MWHRYEWWLLQQARQRNKHIKVEASASHTSPNHPPPTLSPQTFALSWGVPAWVGNGSFYSSDNAAYHVTWLTCMRDAWGVGVDYVGVWNERGFDAGWIKVPRPHPLSRNPKPQI